MMFKKLFSKHRKMTSRWRLVRRILACCMLTVCVLVALPQVSYLQTPPPGGSPQSPKNPKLHFRLVELLSRAPTGPQRDVLPHLILDKSLPFLTIQSWKNSVGARIPQALCGACRLSRLIHKG